MAAILVHALLACLKTPKHREKKDDVRDLVRRTSPNPGSRALSKVQASSKHKCGRVAAPSEPHRVDLDWVNACVCTRLAGSKKARTPPNREGLDSFATNEFQLMLRVQAF